MSRRRTRRAKRTALRAVAALVIAAGILAASSPRTGAAATTVHKYAASGRWHGWAWLAGALLATALFLRLRGQRPNYGEATGPNRRTALYRWYDVEAPTARTRALYIGIAFCPPARADQHSRKQSWWEHVRAARVEWFDTRAEAIAGEARAIARENPVHNDQHNRRDEAAPPSYRKAS